MSTLWKSHNDFHEGLGNLTAEREIPTFPQPLFAFFKKKRKTKADRWRVKQEPDSSLVNNSVRAPIARRVNSGIFTRRTI